jgi:hypothetical protein
LTILHAQSRRRDGVPGLDRRRHRELILVVDMPTQPGCVFTAECRPSTLDDE